MGSGRDGDGEVAGGVPPTLFETGGQKPIRPARYGAVGEAGGAQEPENGAYL